MMFVKGSFNWAVLLLLIMMPFTLLQGQEETPAWYSGNGRITDLLTPGLSATGAPVLFDQSPVADSINPALSALRQRITLDFSYSGISGFDTPEGGTAVAGGAYGHIASLGASFPSKAGVFTLSGTYLNGTSQQAPFGNQGSINFSFAKDVYDDLLFGIGLNSELGEGSGETLWNFGVDLGMIHMPGQVGPVSDFVWGVALQNMGWGTLASAVGEAAPIGQSLFTLETGFSFTAFEKGDFNLGYMADLALPGFVNMRLKTGFVFGYQDVFEFNISTTVDARELAGIYPYKQSSTASLLPAFGFTYRYKPKMNESDDESAFSELHLRSSAAPVGRNELWAYGVGLTIPFGVYDSFPPKIDIFPEMPPAAAEPASPSQTEKPISLLPTSGIPRHCADPSLKGVVNALQPPAAQMAPAGDSGQNDIVKTEGDSDPVIESIAIPENPVPVKYISPNLDGVQDALVVPFTITDKRYIRGYNFTVYNNRGEAVRVIANKEQRKENQERSFFKRLFGKKKGIEIPDQFVWNGEMESGEQAPDGIYHFRVEAWDDNKNIGRSPLFSFVLDNTAPEISLVQPADENAAIFSPNDDGNKDFFEIKQSGSPEDQWTAELYNDLLGVVRRIEYTNEMPSDFSWDGTNDKGILVPDGVYHYQISSLDKSGNSSSANIQNIILSTEQTPIKITIDKSAVSPNSDGVNDSITLMPEIPVTRGIESWLMQIVNREGVAVWERKGSTSVPGEIIYDGLGSDGTPLNEGLYRAALTVLYRNGNNPDSISPEFEVDTTAPSAAVMADDNIFSPDGDGRKDTITFRHDASNEDKWLGVVRDSKQNIIASFEWFGLPQERFTWDGFLADGSVISDGSYSYTLESFDRAGNSGISDQIAFEISTIETPVRLVSVQTAFSPNNDSIQEELELRPDLAVTGGIDEFSLEILDVDGEVVRLIEKGSSVATNYYWDGFQNDGSKAEDALYTARMNVAYKNGNQEQALSRVFTLDTLHPVVSSTADNLIFSPDGDGYKDVTTVSNEGSDEERWEALFTDEEGNEVWSEVWSGEPKTLAWDGSDANGNPVPDGKYGFQISTVDAAGNSTSSGIREIVIDTRSTKLFVTMDQDLISPNGDGVLDSVEFKAMFSLRSGLESWDFKLQDVLTGETVKTFSGSQRAPSSIIWDGQSDSGEQVEGRFTPIFSAVYLKGNHVTSKTGELTVDVTPPKAVVRLAPAPFSPDNDGIEDEVQISLDVEDLAGVEKWLFNIYDPKNRNFKQFKGAGDPVESISWDGRSYRGDLVFSAEDYPYKLQLRDRAGNVAQVEGVIPVDVLVIRDGDQLKIQIANINFAPNSPKLVSNDPAIVERNEYVLKRLAQILEKYASYNIQIEGHANAVKWQNASEARLEESNELQPLSEARADTVKKILVELGIETQRLSSKGMGGTRPVVDPKADYNKWVENSWQNRRVEFILVK